MKYVSRNVEYKPVKNQSSIKAMRTLGKIVKSSFSELWKQAKVLRQIREHLFKKKRPNIWNNSELCVLLISSVPILLSLALQ